MPVKLKEIEGLMVERLTYDHLKDKKNTTPITCKNEKKLVKILRDLRADQLGGYLGFNQAIDLQGSKEITLNREKLALIYLKHLYPEQTIEELTEQWGRRTDWGYVKRDSLAFADAIISAENNLIQLKGRAE